MNEVEAMLLLIRVEKKLMMKNYQTRINWKYGKKEKLC
jgi:hypothetical protein